MQVIQLATFSKGEIRAHFFCPGCRVRHVVRIKGERPGPLWTWNDSLEAPTFTPSVLVTTTWKGDAKTCHFFVTDGQIQFLGDCTHALAGQTVPLSDISVAMPADEEPS